VHQHIGIAVAIEAEPLGMLEPLPPQDQRPARHQAVDVVAVADSQVHGEALGCLGLTLRLLLRRPAENLQPGALPAHHQHGGSGCQGPGGFQMDGSPALPLPAHPPGVGARFEAADHGGQLTFTKRDLVSYCFSFN